MKKLSKSLSVLAIILLTSFQFFAQDTTCVYEIDYFQNPSSELDVSFWIRGDIDSLYNVVTWDFGDGTSGVGILAEHTYDSLDTYEVTATITSAVCGSVTTTTEIILDSVYNPAECYLDFYYEPTEVENEYLFYAFSDGFDDSTQVYMWDFGDSIPVVGQEVTEIFPEEGTYFVTLSAENDECGYMETSYSIYIGDNDTTFCEASFGYMLDSIDLYTVNFFDFDETIEGANYSWEFGDGITSTEQNPVHTYTEEGMYLVTFMVEYGDCTASYEEYVWVGDDNNWYPEECQALFFVEYGRTGFNVDFLDFSWSGNSPITAWSWDFGDNSNSGEQNPSHEYAAAGEYLVTLTIFSQGCTSTFEEMVYVEDNSENGDCQAFFFPIFDGTLSVEFFDLSMPMPTSWAWDFGNGTTSSLQNPTYTYNAPGEYTITLLTTAGDSCMSAFAMDIELIENGKSTYSGEIIQAHAIQVDALSINNVENNATFDVYPNPVVDVLNVDFGNIAEQASIQIFNTNGQLIYSDNVEEVRNIEINTTDFASGLYIMQVIENEQSSSVKFIK